MSDADKILYKFRSFNKFGRKFLTDEEGFFSTPAGLNDPADCSHDLNFYFSEVMRGLAHNEVLLRKIEQIIEYREVKRATGVSLRLPDLVQDRISSAGILSLSTAFDDPLMWSHYGDQHRGFAVGISKNELEANLEANPDSGILALEDVVYEDKPTFVDELIEFLHDKDITPETVHEYGRVLRNKLTVACMLMKYKGWVYEKESRLIRVEAGVHPYFPGSVKKILIGKNASKYNISFLRKFLSSRKGWSHVVLERMQFVPGSFLMESVQI